MIRNRRKYLLVAALFVILFIFLSACQKQESEVLEDTFAPMVIGISPAAGAIDILVDSTIAVTFAEEVDLSSVQGKFSLLQDGTSIEGELTVNDSSLTFQPDSDLQKATSYNVTVNKNISDTSGNLTATDHITTFETTKIPTIESITPVDAAKSIALNSIVTITFSEGMAQATLTSSNVKLMKGTATVSCSLSITSKTATLTPAADLDEYTTYTVKVTTGVTDLAGNPLAADNLFTFTTADFSAPSVKSTTPADNGVDLDIDGPIQVEFSEEMDESTITTSSFQVLEGDQPLAGTITYAETIAVASFTPTSPLSPATTYSAKVTTSIQDSNGIALNGEYVWEFETTRPPSIASVNPAASATGAEIYESITVTFSEEMDATTCTTDSFTLKTGGAEVEGTVSYSNKIASFTPTAALEQNTLYTADISTDIRDAAGNALESGYAWSFTTATIYDFEDLTIPDNFSFSGNAGWFVDGSTAGTGDVSIRAADISDSRTACFETTLAAAQGTLSFFYKVSAETDDGLRFYIDNALTFSKGGDVDWTKYSTSVTAGIHTFKWCYATSYSGSEGYNTAWIDTLSIPGADPNGSLPVVSSPYPVHSLSYYKDDDGQLLQVVVSGATAGMFYFDNWNNSTPDGTADAQLTGGYLEATVDYDTESMTSSGTNYWYIITGNGYGVTRYPASGNLQFTITGYPTISNPSPANGSIINDPSADQEFSATIQGVSSEYIQGFYYDDSDFYYDYSGNYLKATDVSGDTYSVSISFESDKLTNSGWNYWRMEASNLVGTSYYPSQYDNIQFQVIAVDDWGSGFENGVPTDISSDTSPTSDASWDVTSSTAQYGTYSFGSGEIDDSQISCFKMTGTYSTVSFYYRVSSESGFDKLKFYEDNVEQNSWSGESGWISYTHSAVNSSSDADFKWCYEKDSSGNSGSDRAWIDHLIMTAP